jgi:hypothetical protein
MLRDSSVDSDLDSGSFDIDAVDYVAADAAAQEMIVCKLEAEEKRYDAADFSIEIVEI